MLSEVGYRTVICDDDSESSDDQIYYVSPSNVDAAIFISTDYGYDDNLFQYPGVIISPKEAANMINYALKEVNPTGIIKFQ